MAQTRAQLEVENETLRRQAEELEALVAARLAALRARVEALETQAWPVPASAPMQALFDALEEA